MSLGYNAVGAESAKALGHGVEKLQQLNSLTMNPVGLEGAKALGQSLEKLQQLLGFEIICSSRCAWKTYVVFLFVTQGPLTNYSISLVNAPGRAFPNLLAGRSCSATIFESTKICSDLANRYRKSLPRAY